MIRGEDVDNRFKFEMKFYTTITVIDSSIMSIDDEYYLVIFYRRDFTEF